MDIRKKILGIVGVLTLTMSLGAGIAVAQDEPTSSDANVSITVACASTNSVPSTASLGMNPDADSLDFADFDPSGSATSSSTETKAIRLSMNIGQCELDGWSINASITDFSHETTSDVIPGSSFSIPSGEPNASENADSVNGVVLGVVGPSANVTFTTSGGAGIWNGSEAIASHDGVSAVSGEMTMDYTGVLGGLDDSLEAGTYTAEITVTFVPGTP